MCIVQEMLIQGEGSYGDGVGGGEREREREREGLKNETVKRDRQRDRFGKGLRQNVEEQCLGNDIYNPEPTEGGRKNRDIR